MRLIDADKLEAEGYALHRLYQKDSDTIVSEVKKIADVPTIEAEPAQCWGCNCPKMERITEPVRRGRWIKMSDADGIYWACSECGENISRISHYDPQFDLFPRLESIDKTNYCPHCGAKMEEK